MIDNGSNYKKVREELMKIRPHIFWTLCAAHCVDLMLKDIGQLQPVKTVVDAGQKITKFIYNHHIILAWIRKATGGELLRSAITRFATNYIALQSLLKHQTGLKEMFRSHVWLQSSYAHTNDGKEVEGLINSKNFWERVQKIILIIEPLYEVLRVVDDDRTPTLGLVYAKLQVAKNKMQQVSPKYAHYFLAIVEDRWDR